MLSVQRFVAMLAKEQPVYNEKDVYATQGITCVLRTNHAAYRDWVTQFFRYYYQHTRDKQNLLAVPEESCFQLHAWMSHATYQRLLIWIEESLLLSVGEFDDDIAEISLADGGLVVDRQRQLILCFDQSCQHIYFVSSGRDQAVPHELVQMMRALFTWQLQERGYYLLRASAVAKAGQAVVLCGGETSGKTTLLLGLLARGYQLLSDDVCLVGVVDRKLKLLAWPGSIGISLATTAQFDPLLDLYADLAALTLPQHRIQALALDRLAENELDRLDLRMEEVAGIFQTQFVPEAELGQLFLLTDVAPQQNLQPVTDPQQVLQHIAPHFAPLPAALAADPWCDDHFLSAVQAQQQVSAQALERYELTRKILASLPTVHQLSTTRQIGIPQKIARILWHLA